MAATRAPNQPTEWMANGFPPRSFPVQAPRTRTAVLPDGSVLDARPSAPPRTAAPVAGPARRSRGPWAAAAVLMALLLLAAGVALATRGDGDDARVAAGTSTTGAGGDSVPPFDSTTSLVTPSSLEPVGATTADPAPPTAPPTTVGQGVLETSLSTLTIPNVDTAAGPQAASLILRNRGASALSYTTQPSSALLTAVPARGTIRPGGTAEVIVTLDGSTATLEGPFNGSVSIGGTGGTEVVQVSSALGRPPLIFDDVGEPCGGTTTCSTQIKLAPVSRNDASPCNTLWAYAVRITDQSQVEAAAFARLGLGDADAPLGAGAGGPRDVFVSRVMSPVPPGTDLRFVIEAVDQYWFFTRLAEQVISC